MNECKFKRELPVIERIALGLGHSAKKWSKCAHEDRPLGGRTVVCSCQGCGPTCAGFKQDGDECPAAAQS